jgi:DNA-directed RNA polymerase specialized sigma24 family protein
MSSAGFVTELISQVKAGDPVAAQKLWDLFSPRVLGLVNKKLRLHGPGLAEPEEVVLSVLASFFVGARRGQFTQLHDRADLWNLLAAITRNKVVDVLARQARQPSCFCADLDKVLDTKSSLDLHLVVTEQLDRLGDSRLRSIVVWKLEGYTEVEIAGLLGCSVRTVERKVRLIRSIWTEKSEL